MKKHLRDLESHSAVVIMTKTEGAFLVKTAFATRIK